MKEKEIMKTSKPIVSGSIEQASNFRNTGFTPQMTYFSYPQGNIIVNQPFQMFPYPVINNSYITNNQFQQPQGNLTFNMYYPSQFNVNNMQEYRNTSNTYTFNVNKENSQNKLKNKKKAKKE